MCALVPLVPRAARHPEIVERITIPRAETTAPPPRQTRSRRLSAINACERCRKRKIRCDERQPCSSCARFHMTCTRPPAPPPGLSIEAQQALQERVRSLEAQLAEANSIRWNDAWERTAPPRDSMDMQPQRLRLDTNLVSTGRAYSIDGELPAFDTDNIITSPDVPTIEITAAPCESPSSTPLSPSSSPSPFNTITRFSSPDPFSTKPGNYPQTIPLEIPGIAGFEENMWHDDHCMLPSPAMSQPSLHSKRSSISTSISTFHSDPDTDSMNADLHGFNETIWPPNSLDQLLETPGDTTGTPPSPSPTPTPTLTLPPKPEAEALAKLVFIYNNAFRLRIDEEAFKRALDAVYKDTTPHHEIDAAADQSSRRVAKFQVFMVLAIAMKMAPSFDKNGDVMDKYYTKAMQQMVAPGYWDEPDAFATTSLLAAFAEAKEVLTR